ncbi:hypothetical protein NXC14_CH01339 [Rhizobium sp. NXC14]|nr:hypothetical protein NXC14_CH01339 [Rhizobium sp. NXC14]
MPPLKDRKAAGNIKLETIHMVDGICLPQAMPVLQICGTKIFVAAHPDRLWFVPHWPRVSGEGPIAVPAMLEMAVAARFSSFSLRHVRIARTIRREERAVSAAAPAAGTAPAPFQNRSPFLAGKQFAARSAGIFLYHFNKIFSIH